MFKDKDLTNMKPGNLIVTGGVSVPPSTVRERLRGAVFTYRVVKPDAPLPGAKELLDWYARYGQLAGDPAYELGEAREAFQEEYPDETMLTPRELWVWFLTSKWVRV